MARKRRKKRHTNWGRVKSYKRKPTVQSHNRKVSGIGAIKRQGREYYKTQLKNALYSRETAGTKTGRRKAGKRITALKRELRKFQ